MGKIIWVLLFAMLLVGSGNDKSTPVNHIAKKQNSQIYMSATKNISISASLEEAESCNTKEETVNESNDEEVEISTPVYGDYSINILIKNYNEIAEYLIDEQLISDIEELGRPLSKLSITLENGVYVLMRYNDYSQTLYLQYQQEGSDDSEIYPVFRDFIRAKDDSISNDEIEEVWSELQTGNYSYYNSFSFNKIECSYLKQTLIDGRKRYYIKTSYKV